MSESAVTPKSIGDPSDRPAPTDCRVADTVGADQFQPSHRAGYGTAEARTAWVIDWVTRHPFTTLPSGEGALLVKRIHELEAILESMRMRPAVLPDLEVEF